MTQSKPTVDRARPRRRAPPPPARRRPPPRRRNRCRRSDMVPCLHDTSASIPAGVHPPGARRRRGPGTKTRRLHRCRRAVGERTDGPTAAFRGSSRLRRYGAVALAVTLLHLLTDGPHLLLGAFLEPSMLGTGQDAVDHRFDRVGLGGPTVLAWPRRSARAPRESAPCRSARPLRTCRASGCSPAPSSTHRDGRAGLRGARGRTRSTRSSRRSWSW